MNELLRVSQVEDSESDAELILRLLEKAECAIHAERVEDAAEMTAALASGTWDVIIADYHLPKFNAPAALKVLHETGLDIPFIVVSGAIGEDVAVAMMKSGAHDYLVKGNLARLVPAVEREINEARTRHERKQAERALRESELRERARAAELEAVMDAVPAITFIARDPDCRFVTGSRATYELLGLPIGSNLSKSPAEGESPPKYRLMQGGNDIPPEELPMQKAASTGEPVRDCEFELKLEDGSSCVLFGNSLPIMDETRQIRGAIAVFVDITDRKRTEERLRQAQKLESIGLLAGGIAHDFNNILTAVSGNISLALQDLCPKCEVKSILQVAIESVERAAGLTRQLLAYAGKGAFVRARVSVSEVAEKTIQLLRPSVPPDVELRTELSTTLPSVFMDPSQMEQVFINLISNGVEAIRKKQPGVVTVRTSRTDGFLRIEVSDTGSGMDHETQKKIFDPFFTTKFIGRGLGLAAVDGIVRSLNGRISVDSIVGQGTQIQVLLPITEVPEISLEPAVQPAQRPATGGTVLIVDDEPQIRKIAAMFLERNGITVAEASTGKEAIEHLYRSGSGVRVVLLDMAMPELTGDEALPIIRKLRPDIQVIVSSGFSDAEIKQHFGSMRVHSFLPKPYTGEQLLAHVIPALNA